MKVTKKEIRLKFNFPIKLKTQQEDLKKVTVL